MESEEAKQGWARRVQSVHNRYLEWCNVQGALAWPATYDMVSGFICHYVHQNHGSAKSVDNVLSALRTYGRKSGQCWLTDQDQYQLAKVVGRLKFHDTSPTKQAAPATLAVLASLILVLDIYKPEEHMMRVSLLLGHNGLLRGAELFANFKVRDLEWDHRVRKVVITIMRTKTHRHGGGVDITLHDYAGASCYKELKRWFIHNNLWSQLNS